MSGESTTKFLRLYSSLDGEQGEVIEYVLKVGVAATSDKPLFAGKIGEDDPDYKKATIRDMFTVRGIDDDGAPIIQQSEDQQLAPSNGLIIKKLSKERFFEILHPNTKQEAYPSTTTMLNVLSDGDFGLNAWKIGLVIDYFLKAKKDGIEPTRSDAESAANPTIYAERGQRMHLALELYMRGESAPESVLLDSEKGAFSTGIKKINKAITAEHGAAKRIMERGFINKTLGYGGRADMRVNNTVYDLKTTEKKILTQKGTVYSSIVYHTHGLQLAAYALGLEIEQPKLCNIYLNVHTGEVGFHYHDRVEELLRSWKMLVLTWYMVHVGRLPQNDDMSHILAAIDEAK